MITVLKLISCLLVPALCQHCAKYFTQTPTLSLPSLVRSYSEHWPFTCRISNLPFYLWRIGNYESWWEQCPLCSWKAEFGSRTCHHSLVTREQSGHGTQVTSTGCTHLNLGICTRCRRDAEIAPSGVRRCGDPGLAVTVLVATAGPFSTATSPSPFSSSTVSFQISQPRFILLLIFIYVSGCMRDLQLWHAGSSSLTTDGTRALSIGSMSLSHWPAREGTARARSCCLQQRNLADTESSAVIPILQRRNEQVLKYYLKNK